MKDDSSRLLLTLPEKHPDLFQFYKTFQALFWTVEEVDFSKDRAAFIKLPPTCRSYLKNIMSFFFASDSIVSEQLFLRLLNEVQIPEARLALAFQLSQEAVHTETYARSIDATLSQAEKEEAFSALDTNPTVQHKADWMLSHIQNDNLTLGERLVISGACEGVLFSASFCIIFWLKAHQKPVLEGLTTANLFISRDEAQHCKLSAAIHAALDEGERCPQARAHEIFRQAVGVEERFVRESMPVSEIGMNADSMVEYVKLCCNTICTLFGYDSLYPGATNPFPFMDTIGLSTKQNFFEGRTTEYQRSMSERKFALDDDF